jgi:hypothetical protein
MVVVSWGMLLQLYAICLAICACLIQEHGCHFGDAKQRWTAVQRWVYALAGTAVPTTQLVLSSA